VKRKTSTDLNSRLVREGDDALPRKMGHLTAGTAFGSRSARSILPINNSLTRCSNAKTSLHLHHSLHILISEFQPHSSSQHLIICPPLDFREVCDIRIGPTFSAMDSSLPVENSQQTKEDSNTTNTHLKPGHVSRRTHEHTSKHGDNTKMLHRKLECGSEEIDIVLHGPSFNLMNHEPAMHSCPELGCWYDRPYVRIASLMSG
jgi:hypothetical protein